MQVKNHSLFIVNPQAGSDRVGSGWPEVSSMAKKRIGAFQTRRTSGPGDAVSFAREALCNGAGLPAIVEMVPGAINLVVGTNHQI